MPRMGPFASFIMTGTARTAGAVLLLGGLAAGTAGCSRKDAGPASGPPSTLCGYPPSCRQIIGACMSKDDGTPGQVHDCHVLGMEKGIEADCRRDLTGCLAACGAAAPLSDAAPEDPFALCGDAGGDASSQLTFPAAPLSTFQSSTGDLQFELRTAPYQPLHVGPVGEGQLRVSDVGTGAPVDGLVISVKTWMPVMGHACSPVAVNTEPQGQGVYLLTPLLVSMTSPCELQLTFAGSRSGSAVSPTFAVTQ